jgi:integrase
MAISKRRRSDGTTGYGVLVYDRDRGKNRWLGTRDTRTEAKRLEAAWRSGDRIEEGNETFRTFAEQWLATRTHVRQSTRDNYGVYMRRSIEFFGDMRMRDITPRIAEVYLAHLADTVAPLTARTELSIVRQVFKSAIRFGVIKKDPTEGATNLSPRVRTCEIHALTREEHLRLIDATPEYYKALVALWPLIGLRRGEIFGLRRSDVEEGVIHVRQQYSRCKFCKPKTPTSVRDVPLTIEARKWLDVQLEKGIPNKNDLLFASTFGNPVDANYFSRNVFRPALKEAGLPEIRLHDLRHTYATWCFHSGMNPRVIQAWMGHATLKVTVDTYSHLLPHSEADSLALLQQQL